MSYNDNLSAARVNKNDEFYTLYEDIEKELKHYNFKDKIVYCPCDNPNVSNFTKYFKDNFEKLGIKRLVSTCYPQGLLEVIDKDSCKSLKLKGDGDFKSEEVKKVRDEADIIVTNPPFSLFRPFWAWLWESEKKFLLIANKNCITYKEVFPFVMANKVWSGCRPWAGGMWFISPNDEYVDKVEDGKDLKNVPSIWITNLEHGRRHQSIPLMTTADIFKFSRHADLREQGKFLKYDNYDAIEVPKVDSIPSDYDGIMGVPITFLDKYCPEQFEILGMAAGNSRACGFYYNVPYTPHSEDRGGCGVVNGQRVFSRIFIQRRTSV